MTEKGLASTDGDMTETEFVKLNLSHTIPLMAAALTQLPESSLWVRPAVNVDPPGWMVACYVNEENRVVSFLRDVRVDIPEELRLFTKSPSLACSMPDDQADEAENTDMGIDRLLSYMKHVRAQTNTYLDGIDDDDLTRVPELGVEERGPIREEFIKLIWMQNFTLGKLVTAAQCVFGSEQEVETPKFAHSNDIWEDIDIQEMWGRP